MDSDSQDDSANLEIKCRYQFICDFGKNVSEHPEDCPFHRMYQKKELELLVKEDIGIISGWERKYLKELSGCVEK